MYDRPFRWWVQSVMPLVFDDSLSYYEVLAKLTMYIEGLTGDVEQIEKILGTIEGIEDVTQFTEMLENIQNEIGNLSNLSTQTKTNLVSAINEIALKADIAYWKPPTGIPESDLSPEVRDKLNKTASPTEFIINNNKLKPAPSNNTPAELGLGTYTVPTGGIPWDTLSDDVKNRINEGGSGGGTTDYSELNNKPQINGHTLNAGNNTAESLGLGTYNKPSYGIPESDLSAAVQEKLNTSGGIAGSQEGFVAVQDYEAGELVYINGTLYRVKYKILAGTTLVPGNNIEATDISSELEKINDDIDALQSGAGPDSWNLTGTVQSYSHLEIVDFFEYFNCIGGENYNFIVDPVDPANAAAYYLDICKRDGTVVLSQHVTEAVDYANRKRFTFVPTDSGEYYCKFYRTASGYPTTISAVKVTIEYTQSQGISELWNKINEAVEIGDEVPAIKALAESTADNVEDLKEFNNEILESKCVHEVDSSSLAITIGGGVNPTTGGNINSNPKYARIGTYQVDQNMIVKIDSDEYLVCCWGYSGTGTGSAIKKYTDGYARQKYINIVKGESKWFRMGFMRVDGNNMTSGADTEGTDEYELRRALKYYTTTDESLTTLGANADAYATGMLKDLNMVDYTDKFEYLPGLINNSGEISAQTTPLQLYTPNAVENVNGAYVEGNLSEQDAFEAYFATYNENGQFIENVGYRQPSTTHGNRWFKFNDNVKSVRFWYSSRNVSNIKVQLSFRQNEIDYTEVNEKIANEKTDVLEHPILNPMTIKPIHDHLFVSRTTNIVIPHESIYHIRLSKKMGFDVFELNCVATSDGVYVVNHFSDYKFGPYFEHVDGVTDISDVAVNAVTWDWIQDNVRYKSTLPIFRTAPERLETALRECKTQGLIPMVQLRDNNMHQIVERICGKYNYIAYKGNRTVNGSAVISSWENLTKEEIFALCENMGAPFIYGVPYPTNFSDNELIEIINGVHERGCLIGTGYQDYRWPKYKKLGMDCLAGIRTINRIENGNICNYSSYLGFSDFAIDGTTHATDNGLMFDTASDLIPNISNDTYFLSGFDLEIVFNGSIILRAIGEFESDRGFDNDGSYPTILSIPVVNGSPKPTIRVLSGTVIKSISFKASKFA